MVYFLCNRKRSAMAIELSKMTVLQAYADPRRSPGDWDPVMEALKREVREAVALVGWGYTWAMDPTLPPMVRIASSRNDAAKTCANNIHEMVSNNPNIIRAMELISSKNAVKRSYPDIVPQDAGSRGAGPDIENLVRLLDGAEGLIPLEHVMDCLPRDIANDPKVQTLLILSGKIVVTPNDFLEFDNPPPWILGCVSYPDLREIKESQLLKSDPRWMSCLQWAMDSRDLDWVAKLVSQDLGQKNFVKELIDLYPTLSRECQQSCNNMFLWFLQKHVGYGKFDGLDTIARHLLSRGVTVWDLMQKANTFEEQAEVRGLLYVLHRVDARSLAAELGGVHQMEYAANLWLMRFLSCNYPEMFREPVHREAQRLMALRAQGQEIPPADKMAFAVLARNIALVREAVPKRGGLIGLVPHWLQLFCRGYFGAAWLLFRRYSIWR